MNYKFKLDKTSKKFRCPNCHKKTFVKYVDSETNCYLEATIGRCDRESKCRYHKTPKSNKPLVVDLTVYQPPAPSFHKDVVIGQFGRNHMSNNFVTYLLHYFPAVDVEAGIKRYFIGTSTKWSGSTVFWQVDQNMRVHSGKVMLYNKLTGKRVKKPYVHVSWMHKVLNEKDFLLQQCLFGLHNLNDCKFKTIAIVESEKTAIIMSILRPNMIWMATGAKTNFKPSMLEPLKGRKIIAYPDKTEFEDWSLKAQSLRRIGFNVACSDLLEHKDLEDGDDLVDFFNLTKNAAL